ncbi:MAG: hypothetical protein JJE22_20245 [Bacteroidia bacterium]|nr:hypothetical protein [Bacteroidia bacterium]
MKSKPTCGRQTRALILFMSLALIITDISISAATPTNNPNFNIGNAGPVKKNKTISTRNNPSVKIYPDAVKKSIHIVAKKNYGKSIDFFVFNLEGTLMQNCKMKSRDHMKISGLKKGSYVFRVFCGDEETASGNFEIL